MMNKMIQIYRKDAKVVGRNVRELLMEPGFNLFMFPTLVGLPLSEPWQRGAMDKFFVIHI